MVSRTLVAQFMPCLIKGENRAGKGGDGKKARGEFKIKSELAMSNEERTTLSSFRGEVHTLDSPFAHE
jgi:hypothetical protein